MIKTRYRIKHGVRYLAYRTFNTYVEAQIDVLKLRLAGVPAIVYNNYKKRNFIVFVKEVTDDY